MDSPEKEITVKDVLSPVSTQPNRGVDDKDKSLAVIGRKSHYRRALCSISEEGAYSPYESLESNPQSGRKRRKTTRNRAEKIPYEQKVAEKYDELVQSVTIPDNKDDPSPSAYRDWLLIKLENLQERLDEGLQKFMDEMDSGHPPCMHLDPPAMPQSDLHAINNQSFLKSSPKYSPESDEERLDSPPALSLRASISPIKVFENAYQSRISFVQKFEEPDRKGKSIILERAIRRVTAQDLWKTEAFSDEDYGKLAENNLSGREVERGS
ncbi:hypothetical protein MKX08_005036 [Trichoderma sp. CBMAI-0020]|nr:hypothetical protein MKX08_005036 [Trichoderma sp. CBMAI-0020]WOD46630.1 hypothetical protein [Trichoderma atroviride]